MRLTKYKYFMLLSLAAFPISGCIYGDLKKQAENDLNEISLVYCLDRQLPFCEKYQSCFMKQLSLLRNDSARDIHSAIISNSSVSYHYSSPYSSKYRRFNFKETMDNIYNWILKIEQKNLDENLAGEYSLALYIHNACADITGDKKYNIDRYIPFAERHFKNAGK